MMCRMARKSKKDGLHPELLSLVRRLQTHFSTLPIPPRADPVWIGEKKGADADECRRVAAVDTHQRRRPSSRRSAPH
jgi:hypothetical protein